MYLVMTRLGRSDIHGVGVFAEEEIPAGTVVSRFVPGFDLSFPADYLDTVPLPPNVRDFIEDHSYIIGEQLVMPGDLDMFTNHSFAPNVGYNAADDSFFALRDIRAGEELTNDYREFSEWARQNMVEGIYR